MTAQEQHHFVTGLTYLLFFSRLCQKMFPNPSGRGSGGSGPFGSRSGGLHPTDSGIKRADPTGASRLDPARGPQQPLSPSAQATQAFAEGHVPANPQNDPFLPRRVEHGLTGRAEMPGNGVFNPNYPGLPDDRRNILPRSGDERQGDVHNRPMMPGKLRKLQHFELLSSYQIMHSLMQPQISYSCRRGP